MDLGRDSPLTLRRCARVRTLAPLEKCHPFLRGSVSPNPEEIRVVHLGVVTGYDDRALNFQPPGGFRPEYDERCGVGDFVSDRVETGYRNRA